MAKLNRKQIQERAREILETETGGIRWGEILKLIHGADPETPPNSIHCAIQVLFQGSDDIVKVARGSYQLAKYVDADAADAVAADEAIATVAIDAGPTGAGGALTEQDFYASFAEWLVENDEATVAEALGGSSLGGKWGTPDVLGVMKPRAQDIFRFEPKSLPPKSRQRLLNLWSPSVRPSPTGYFRTKATSSFHARRAAMT